jgi:hypothetical protein
MPDGTIIGGLREYLSPQFHVCGVKYIGVLELHTAQEEKGF